MRDAFVESLVRLDPIAVSMTKEMQRGAASMPRQLTGTIVWSFGPVIYYPLFGSPARVPRPRANSEKWRVRNAAK